MNPNILTQLKAITKEEALSEFIQKTDWPTVRQAINHAKKVSIFLSSTDPFSILKTLTSIREPEAKQPEAKQPEAKV